MKKRNLSAEWTLEEIKQIRGRKPRRDKQLNVLAEYEAVIQGQTPLDWKLR